MAAQTRAVLRDMVRKILVCEKLLALFPKASAVAAPGFADQSSQVKNKLALLLPSFDSMTAFSILNFEKNNSERIVAAGSLSMLI